ncbi:MAG: tRNA 2-thiocytidine(32) synthetase TtcA [Bradymonadaceae bacterium]|nr:tRNA 2-thiocytidine(32) synthetase TtcA [Lujinxingiaceae bacterium]
MSVASEQRAIPLDFPPVSGPVMKFVRQAVRDFDLISPGDRVAVGMSGGKDSLLLAAALRELSLAGDFDFEVQPIHLDQNQPGFDRAGFDAALERLGMSCLVIDKDTYSVVQAMLKPGQIPCALCGRMRRGILNKFCADNGYNKLALGHHLDDAVETFFLNLLFGRKLDALKPATPATGIDVVAIRPLILVEERKIEAWVSAHGLTTVACPVCDSHAESRRRDLKGLVEGFRGLHADVHDSIRAALYSAPQ